MELHLLRLNPELPLSRRTLRYVSASRREKVERMRHPEDRKRSLTAELMLRCAASRICGIPPRNLTIANGPYGKPYLPDVTDFNFNLSHSGQYVVLAIGHLPLGVDVERMQPMEDTMKRYDNICYVGAQAKQSGEMCAQALINYWNSKKDIADKNGDGKLQLVILQGEIGQQDVTLRTDAYKETLEKNGIEYEILACDTANWDQAQALDKMNAWITAYGIDGIEGVLCNNDSMAMGAVQACINNGYNSGDAGKFVPIVGIDANIDALEAMKAGSLLGTVLNDRKSQSDAIINVIKAVHAGTEITEDVVGVDCTVDGKYVWVPYVIVDESNLSATLEDMLAVAQSE